MNELASRLNAALSDWHDDCRRGLLSAGEFVLTEAKKRAPSNTGALRDSGSLRSLSDDCVQIIFTAPNAAQQHERLDFQHPNGGQAKFLESVLLEFGLDILSHIGGDAL